MDAVLPRIYLVGAGPGAPGLMTVRAVELLARADLIVYDQLVPKRLLDGAKPNAETICIRDLPGQHPEKYPQVLQLLIEHARSGRTVVRLKGGDPLIFGRGGEETAAFREAGIDYEIVPGVTAALAAAAYLDIPLTMRGVASAVALVTGHELPGKPGATLDWSMLARFPGTLAIYMGVSRLSLIIEELLKHGKSPDEPSGIIERASTGEMRSVFAPLARLDEARREAGLEAPGMILIGESVGLRNEPSWFESKPLFGKRVLVTRPRHQSAEFVRMLEEEGAVPVVMPAIEIRPPRETGPLDEAIRRLKSEDSDWVVFTSANSVRFLMSRIMELGFDLRILGRVRIAAVGRATSDALRAFHLQADLIPEGGANARALAEAIKPLAAGSSVLFPRADAGKDTLIDELRPIATVHPVAVYEQQDVVDVRSEAFRALRRGEIQFVTMTSANIARVLCRAFDEVIRERIRRHELQLAVLSDDVASAVREFDLPVARIASEPSLPALLTCLINAMDPSAR